MIPGDGSDPFRLNFTWEFISYDNEEGLKFKLDYEYPLEVSQKEDDVLKITFWGNENYLDINGNRVEQGTSILFPVLRQFESERQRTQVEYTSLYTSVTVGCVLLACLIFLVLSRSKTLLFWNFMYSLQILLHLPLAAVNSPANVAMFV